MRTKVISLLLVLCFAVGLVPFSAGASDRLEFRMVPIAELPQREEAKKLLLWFFLYKDTTYSCETAVSEEENIFEDLISLPDEDHVVDGTTYYGRWSIYPGSSSRIIWGPEDGPPDPLKRWSSYAYSDKARIDWIMTNILNCSPSDLDSLIARWKADPAKGYEYQGKYYAYFDPDAFGEFSWDIELTSAAFDGYFYYIEYDEYYGPLTDDPSLLHMDKNRQHRYATMAVKEIDGKEYWSIYGITSSGFLRFDPPASSDTGSRTFIDVPDSAYYSDAVDWAVRNAITDGTSPITFSPFETVTRGQAVTFLWRAAGKPAPRSTLCPFSDVRSADYYYQAVLWALEQGITNGTSSTTFSPGVTLTRGHIVTFQWRAAGRPENTGASLWYADAQAWAEKAELLEGTAVPYTPEGDCPRADVVTYLYRADQKGLPSQDGKTDYAFVLDGCSWSEAFRKAIEAGGHLVHIDSRAEYNAILAEIADRGMEYAEFRIGARRNDSSHGYYWADSENDLIGERLNDSDSWASSAWAAGEPSFRWGSQDETVAEISYSPAQGRWLWNDIPDTTIEPGTGLYPGYIIEFGGIDPSYSSAAGEDARYELQYYTGHWYDGRHSDHGQGAGLISISISKAEDGYCMDMMSSRLASHSDVPLVVQQDGTIRFHAEAHGTGSNIVSGTLSLENDTIRMIITEDNDYSWLVSGDVITLYRGMGD